MAIELEGGCGVSEMRAGPPVVNGTLRIWNQIGRATGAQAISLRILEYAPGLSPGFRNDECDEILYVLGCWERGRPVRLNEHSERTLAQVYIEGQTHDIDLDTGIYLRPGQTLAVNNLGPDSLVIVSCRCPEPASTQEFVTPPTPSSDSVPAERPPLVP